MELQFSTSVRLTCLGLIALAMNAQTWQQWGQNPQHTGSVSVSAQKPERVLAQFTYDPLADAMRQENGEDLLVHYMTPLVDGADVFTLSRGASRWVSCVSAPPPCGTARWGQMEWGITKLSWTRQGRPGVLHLAEQWSSISTWKPPPDNGSGWEPVFHPALAGSFVYMPGDAGSIVKVDRASGAIVGTVQPFGERDIQRFVTSPLTVDGDGSIYYTVMRLDAAGPWNRDVQEAWLVKVDTSGGVRKSSFASLVAGAPSVNCVTTFSASALPWPPATNAKPPAAACGAQRPALNAAPAVGPDGTVYLLSRAHFNGAYSYLVAVNADLTPRWAASLRDRLRDGCGVLLPANGTVGGCRSGSATGVDPATNDLPAGVVTDLSTASPAIAPDGSILVGAYTRYNYARGHLFRFSSGGLFLNAYDFGWDITPAIYAHDGTWSVILKDNFYPLGSYCSVPDFCGQAAPRYSITSLRSDLTQEWSFANTNNQLCNRNSDGSISCTPWTTGFEWCVNMMAVDRAGTVYANSEDGNVYAIDRAGKLAGNIFLKSAIGAAYTPLAIGGDGRVYTQNDGTLYVVGGDERRVFRR